MNSCYAFLSNKDGFTVFKYGNYVIRFKAPYSLEKYMEVKQWDEGYQILNLNRPDKAIVLSVDGETLETTMDDIEIQIVKDYYNGNKKYLEE